MILELAELLKTITVEVECMALESIVAQINETIENIATHLYEDPISITLKLSKEVKSTKQIKPEANFIINYKGGEIKKIKGNGISGGEKDRLSILLTLALNKFMNSPLLIFDESMKGNHEDIKENIVRAIREYSMGTVVVVLHAGVEGVYDNVVDLNQQG